MNDQQGHLYDVPLLGQTLPEHGLGRRAVHLHSNHYLTLGSTGSGKLLTSAAHQLLGWPYDLIAITQKEDLCNLALGRRCDPNLFANVSLVRKWGRRLGVDASGISKTKFHLTGGRCMNVDLGGATAYPYTRYTFLSDVRIHEPGAMARLMAIARALVPEQKKNASGDPFWQLAPQGAIAAVSAHVLTTESDPRKQTLPYATQRLLGVDPATRRSSPKNQVRLFKEMMLNPRLGGYIAAQGAELYNLGEKTLGPLTNTIGTRLRWMLSDPRICDILTGPSDFSMDDFGRGATPLSCFVTPSRGDRSTEAFLQMFLELAVLMFQQRQFVPARPILLIADEVPSWGEEQVDTLRKAMNILRDRKIVCWLYGQSYSQFVDLVGEHGAAEMLSATTLQAFGVRDKITSEMLRDRVGRTTVRRGGAMREEVFLADTDAIYDELAAGSALQYVIPYSGRPLRLYRPGFVTAKTKEGLSVRGLGYAGHYDDGLLPYSP